MSKTAIRPKHALDILRTRIAEAYVLNAHLVTTSASKSAEVTIPLWVAEELKAAMEKQ